MSITHLKEGDKAPDFTGKNQDGKDVSLSDFRGKKLVLYFYPKDMTPGCTAEACNLADNYRKLLDSGFEVLGVSADSEKQHSKFVDKYELPFDLIADTEMDVINKYGVHGEKKFMGKTTEGIHRTTFLVDENGTIEKIFKKVKTKDHAAQILEEVNA